DRESTRQRAHPVRAGRSRDGSVVVQAGRIGDGRARFGRNGQVRVLRTRIAGRRSGRRRIGDVDGAPAAGRGDFIRATARKARRHGGRNDPLESSHLVAPEDELKENSHWPDDDIVVAPCAATVVISVCDGTIGRVSYGSATVS